MQAFVSYSKISFIIFSLLIMAGCASTTNYNSVENLNSSENANPRLIIMPIDVELSILGATGVTEVQAEWTADARGFLEQEITDHLAANNSDATLFNNDVQDIDSVQAQPEKLHEAVGYSILVHEVGAVKLPTRPKNGTWTLGEKASVLKEKTGADYALFVFMRDSYASAGRKAMQVFGALVGVGIPGGTQLGFSSLVDLNTGDIVWFNRLISSSGDLREQDSARETVANLLDSIPSA
ncbi:hypothetical protein [Planctobacterium marinum]|uniref:hypothetical protein n=1 Tax=Planctobacterium marinum TaxID=1631968 RepID=UPI001E40A997|nr:hypothetical protein [Planctobacterium marinum]MCC2608153.1 hypothetical protein [Planctobacterium marinum]